MKPTFLFPGQGGQRMGMLKDVPQEYLDLCEKTTGYSLVESEDAYRDTVFIQLAILLKDVVALDRLKAEGIEPGVVAGHSIGAFTAAVAAGALDLENALSLVFHRATLMKQAYPSDYAMGVIIGLTRSEVQKIVDTTFQKEYPVYLSNENSELQQALSGHIKGLEATLAVARQSGAQNAKLILVPVPSHSPLMKATVDQFRPFVNEAPIHAPNCWYIKNFDGRGTKDAAEIRKDLLLNLEYPVLWNDMMDVIKELGTKIALEFPPGHTLSRLLQGKFSEEAIRLISIDDHGLEDSLFLYEKWKGKLQ